MATLNLKSIATIVANQAAAIQASATALIDFSTGSILRAVVQSNAAVAVWLQGLVLNVLAISRLATSFGTDVDTFVNDFGMYRLSSSQSAGLVTFSRIQTTNSALIPVGAQVQSADGTQTFQVIADATNSAYVAAMNGYLIAAGIASLAVKVSSTNAGTAANVVAGGVNRLLTPISGVDYVSNAGAMSGGANAETDSAVKIRFVLYLLGLRAANFSAVAYAVVSLQLGLQYQIVNNYAYSGALQPGYFYVVIDDGTGSPPSTLLTAAYTAISAVAALGVVFGVFAPTVTTANVSGTITVAAGYTSATVKAAVAVAWTQFVSNLGLGNMLSYAQLESIAFSIPGVTDVTVFLINGATVDIAANPQVTIKPGTVSAN